MVKLVDGLNNRVPINKRSIKKALLDTDLVQDVGEINRLSRFFGGTHPDGDEYDVYDSRLVYDPQTVFEIEEIDEAVDEFLELVKTL